LQLAWRIKLISHCC